MPAEVAGRAVGDGDAGRLRVDQRPVAVAGRVVAGVEFAHERLEVDQVAGRDVDIDAEPAGCPPAVELGVDSPVRAARRE